MQDGNWYTVVNGKTQAVDTTSGEGLDLNTAAVIIVIFVFSVLLLCVLVFSRLFIRKGTIPKINVTPPSQTKQTVKCRHCGANNQITLGEDATCEYCNSAIQVES